MPRIQSYYTDLDIERAIRNLQVGDGNHNAAWMRVAINEYLQDEELRTWLNPLIKRLIQVQRRLASEKNEKVIFGPAMAFELLMAIYLGDRRGRQRLIRLGIKLQGELQRE